MRQANTVDLGSVQMHKKVIGDIAVAALNEIPGVNLAEFGFLGDLFDVFGYKHYPAVSVRSDKNGDLSLNLRVNVDYGLNIPNIASRIQDTVREAIEKTVDIDDVEINVNIQSVQRRDS